MDNTLLTALGGAGVFLLGWLLKAARERHNQTMERKALVHKQDAEDRADALKEWEALANRLEGRIKFLEDEYSKVNQKLFDASIENSACKARLATLEHLVLQMEKGAGPRGPIETPAIIVADRYGVVTEVNAALTLLLGYTRETLIGQSIETLMPERYKVAHRTAFTRLAAADNTTWQEKVLRAEALHADGREIPVTIRAAVQMDVEGRRVFSAAITRRGVPDGTL